MAGKRVKKIESKVDTGIENLLFEKSSDKECSEFDTASSIYRLENVGDKSASVSFQIKYIYSECYTDEIVESGYLVNRNDVTLLGDYSGMYLVGGFLKDSYIGDILDDLLANKKISASQIYRIYYFLGSEALSPNTIINPTYADLVKRGMKEIIEKYLE